MADLRINFLPSPEIAHGDRHYDVSPEAAALLGYLILEPGSHSTADLLSFLASHPGDASALPRLEALWQELEAILDHAVALTPPADNSTPVSHYFITTAGIRFNSESGYTCDLEEMAASLRLHEAKQPGAADVTAICRALERCRALPPLPTVDQCSSGLLSWMASHLQWLREQAGAACAVVIDYAVRNHESETIRRAAEIWTMLLPLRQDAYRALAAVHQSQGRPALAEEAIQTWQEKVAQELGGIFTVLDSPTAPGLSTAAEMAVPAAGDGVPTRLPTVNRESEMSWLQQQYERVRRGTSVLVALEGEVGVGKMSLVAQFCQQAQAHGARLAQAWCYDAEMRRPYEPLGTIVQALLAQPAALSVFDGSPNAQDTWAELGRLVPALHLQWPDLPPGPPIQGESDAHRLHAAISTLLDALGRSRPLILGFYDMQWCDRATVLFIQYLLRQQRGAQIMVIVTYRPEELEDNHPLQSLLHHHLRGSEVQRLRVLPLTLQALRQQWAGLWPAQAGDAFSEYVWQESEGNPFYLAQTVTSWLESGLVCIDDDGRAHWAFDLQVPGEWPEVAFSLRAALQRRLEALDVRARQLLTALAICGKPTSPARLQQILSWQPAAVEATLAGLKRAGFAEEALLPDLSTLDKDSRSAAGQPVFFSHPLLRRMVYEQIDRSTRMRLHARVARVFNCGQHRYRALMAAEVAAHLRSAGADGAALPGLLTTAGWAMGLNALSEASDLYWVALHLATRGGDTATQMMIHRALGDCHKLRDDYRAAHEHYQAAFGCAADPANRVAIRSLMAEISVRRGEYGAALTYIRAALEESQLLPAGVPPGALTLTQAELYLRQGDLDAAARSARHARHQARHQEPPDADVDVRAMLLLSEVYEALGQVPAAIDILDAGLALSERTSWLARTRERLGRLSVMVSDLERAQTNLAGALACYQVLGDWDGEARTLSALSHVHEARGDLGAALQCARQALAVYSSSTS